MEIEKLKKRYWVEQRFRNLVDGLAVYMMEHNIMADDIINAIDGEGDKELIKYFSSIEDVSKYDLNCAVHVAFEDICHHGETLKKAIDRINKTDNSLSELI